MASIKERFQNAVEGSKKITRGWRNADLRSAVANMEPAAVAEALSTTFQTKSVKVAGRLLTIILCTYFLAEVTALFVGEKIPNPPPSRAFRMGTGGKRARSIGEYEVIMARGLLGQTEEQIPGVPGVPTGEPVRTTLPWNLVGTLVLRDELRSVATIEDKSAQMVYPVRAQDEIPQKARIIRVEPRRVVFVNLTANRPEFIELPEELNAANVLITPGRPRIGGVAAKPGGPGIEQVSPTAYNVSRAEVDRSLADLSNVLTQARAVPNFENGMPSGYKLFQIVPGSIYDKLGLKNGDVIAGINGESINDPAKALKLLEELKSANHLELQVKRDGRPQTNAYNIN